MFNGCTALETAPELSAESLASHCYEGMFRGCTALSSVTMLATDVSAEDCLGEWLENAGTNVQEKTLSVTRQAYEQARDFFTIFENKGWQLDIN